MSIVGKEYANVHQSSVKGKLSLSRFRTLNPDAPLFLGMGGERSVMGFCKWDRIALKGLDLLNYSDVRDDWVENFVTSQVTA